MEWSAWSNAVDSEADIDLQSTHCINPLQHKTLLTAQGTEHETKIDLDLYAVCYSSISLACKESMDNLKDCEHLSILLRHRCLYAVKALFSSVTLTYVTCLEKKGLANSVAPVQLCSLIWELHCLLINQSTHIIPNSKQWSSQIRLCGGQWSSQMRLCGGQWSSQIRLCDRQWSSQIRLHMTEDPFSRHILDLNCLLCKRCQSHLWTL